LRVQWKRGWGSSNPKGFTLESQARFSAAMAAEAEIPRVWPAETIEPKKRTAKITNRAKDSSRNPGVIFLLNKVFPSTIIMRIRLPE